jgi:peptidoglycan/LPS O-acetylase OafA/YrhL
MTVSLMRDQRYRPDVDGLRAIAVLAVIFFHIDKSLLPGGFVGVDVFFVISGFLITRNIIAQIDNRSFSIIEFYRRRIKRIAPAMLVVVAVTMALSQWLLLPEDSRNTAKSAVWSLLSMANVYFWLYQDAGYFAADSAHAPLLHLWSLGIEEQFYLLWPLLLWAFYRLSSARRFFGPAAAVLVASFVLGDLLYERAPSFVYYMLPTRAGELLAGGLVAFALNRRAQHGMAPATLGLCAASGFILLVGSLLLLSERVPFPGRYALPPTLGAALLILGGEHPKSIATRALSVRPLVWIGLISYSAYLWHWPLLAFYRYGYGAPGLLVGLLVFSLTMTLAWLTYRYVEQPVRRSRASALRVAMQYLVVPGCVLMLTALVLVYPAKFGVDLQAEDYRQALARLREDAQPAFTFEWACQRQRVTQADAVDPRCVLGAELPIPPKAILWGDSNAAHYIGVVNAIASAAGFRFRNLEVGSCPPIHSDPKALSRLDGWRIAGHPCRFSSPLSITTRS